MKRFILIITVIISVTNIYSNKEVKNEFHSQLIIYKKFEIKSENSNNVSNDEIITNSDKAKVKFQLKNVSNTDFNGKVRLIMHDKYVWSNRDAVAEWKNVKISKKANKQFEKIVYLKNLSKRKKELFIEYRKANEKIWGSPEPYGTSSMLTIYKNSSDSKRLNSNYRDLIGLEADDIIPQFKSIYYKQGHPRKGYNIKWKNDLMVEYNNNIETIEHIGCLMTNFSMILATFGKGTNPRYLNSHLRFVGGV